MWLLIQMCNFQTYLGIDYLRFPGVIGDGNLFFILVFLVKNIDVDDRIMIFGR